MKKVIYWSTFDENGVRTGTFLEGIHEIPETAIPLTEEEWKIYCSSNYRRNPETHIPEYFEPPDEPSSPQSPTVEDRLMAVEEALLMIL